MSNCVKYNKADHHEVGRVLQLSIQKQLYTVIFEITRERFAINLLAKIQK